MQVTENYWIEKKQKEPSWTPYCLKCTALTRTKDANYGFYCDECGSKINFKMEPIRNER